MCGLRNRFVSARSVRLSRSVRFGIIGVVCGVGAFWRNRFVLVSSVEFGGFNAFLRGQCISARSVRFGEFGAFWHHRCILISSMRFGSFNAFLRGRCVLVRLAEPVGWRDSYGDRFGALSDLCEVLDFGFLLV